MLAGDDNGDATTPKLEDGSTLVHQSNVSNTFLLASPSDFDISGSAVYEISSISSDGIVIQTDPHIEEVKCRVLLLVIQTDPHIEEVKCRVLFMGLIYREC